MFLLNAKLIVGRPQILALSGFKVRPRRFQQTVLEWDNSFVIDAIARKAAVTVSRLEQPVQDQVAGTDQHCISSKRRHRLVRRIPITSRAERQRLPPSLASIAEPI